eukprot:s574_g24.t1
MVAMSKRIFHQTRSQVRASFDELENWIFETFGEGRYDHDESEEEIALEVAKRRRGMRFFTAGRPRDRKRFASILFPIFHGDPNEALYEEAFQDVLRVAGVSVKPQSRHKLSFRGGILYFTADSQGNLYAVVASDDFPMASVYEFLDEMLEAGDGRNRLRPASGSGQVYESIDVASALDQAEESLWAEQQFVEDAFGVRELALTSWKKRVRPGDGSSFYFEEDAPDFSQFQTHL